uniref:Reverse transcriptase domain-containing protein n=1 Tax=Fagus sylvatica TaxID=28930 RepID=A0A2N9I2R0_FAGSY
MAGETSGPGPSEQEIRMVALERKFDELLSFVQLIAKRNTDDENQRKEDDKDTSEEPEGHSNTNATPPRPPTPPKPEGKDSQLDSKIDSLEEKIRLIQGLNSFGNTDFSSMSWFPNMTMPPKFKAPEFEKYNGRGDPMIHLQMYCRKMAPYADNEPLLIQTFQDTLTGNAAEWYSQLKKISHWKELADTFLAQYGFNSQIAPDRFDLQRMEKKSNETFREYAQRWREKAARARPPLDEREMIKIFVDTLKNPYFDRMIGLQMQFFVDLIPPNKPPRKLQRKKKEGDVQMIGRSNGRPRQALPTFTMQPIQPRPTPMPAPAQAPTPAPVPQMPARPVGNQANDNRLVRKEPRQFTPLPMPLMELYPILIEKNLISPVVPRPYNGPQRRDFDQNSTCDFHFGEVGHTVNNCQQLRHRVQDLIDHGILKFEGLPNITTNPLPNHPEGGVNMVEIEERGEERIAWRRLFYTLEKQRHITPLECCEEFKKKVTDLMEKGLVGREEIPSEGSHQPDDPSDFDWYAELNLDDIVEDEMDLDNLQDEGADWGYFMEDDTDEWRDVHLQKYGEKMALHLENELLMISVFPESLSKQAAAWFYQLRNLTGWDDLARVFLERYRFNPHSILEYLGLKEDEEPYVIPDPGVNEVIVEIKEESSMSSLPALTEGEEEEKAKPLPPAKDPDSIAIAEEGEEPVKMPPPSNNNTTTSAEEEYAGPMVGRVEHPHHHQGGGFHHYTTDPPLPTGRRSQDVDLCAIATACLKETRRGVQTQHRGVRRIINLADEGEEPREVKIGTRCTTEQKEALIALLREFHEIFAWSYQDMPGLDTDIVVHKIPLKPECKPVKQALRRMKPEDGKVRMCVDYRDLNRASPKDNFPLPHIDTLVDNTATNAVFSFMDGFSGYNQIKMAEEDKSKTAFVTHWGTFVYDVMPFGLKNAGATYQRAMVTLFHDMIHHEIEVYVDDMIAKSRNRTRSSHRPTQAVPATEEVSAQTKPEQVCLWRHIRKVIRLCHNPIFTHGFSQVSVLKTGQPELNQHDLTTLRRIKYSQEEGPGHISRAHLGGSVCAKILSDPLQLGPRAKTLRQEVHFSYHMQLSDRQEFLRSSRNLSQKMTPWHKEHSDGLRSQDHILRTQTRLCARPVPQRKLSDGTKNVKIRHRELGQICARTGTRFEKKRAGSKTHFFSRTAAFARRVFPARNKLIREPGCVGKIMTPATTWNSRFADSIPRLTGIYVGKVHKNSSDTPTSGSHNSLVRTPIRVNFISLERGRRELSEDMPHDPF